MSIHLLVILSLLFPIPAPMIMIIIAAGYGLCHKRKAIVNIFKRQRLIVMFFAFSGIISLSYRNWVGLTVTACVFILFLYLIYLKTDMDFVLFHKSTNLLLVGSWFHALYAVLQHYKIFFGPDYHTWHHSMISWRDGRADSVFLNPNYYAFMCIIYILIVLYKFQVHQHNAFYFATIVLNIIGILCSQSRTALSVVVIVSFIFYYYIVSKKERKWLNIAAFWVVLASPLLQLLPRFNITMIIHHLVEIRFEIWDMAFVMFQKHWLFGTGPFSFFTYFNHYYSGVPTQHAHNLYVDSLLNYGLVGSALLVCIFVAMIRKMLDKKATNKPLAVLGISLMALVLLHGILDVSIVFIHTLSIFGFLMVYITDSNT